MSKIKIKDLPKDMKISKAEMEKITGGTLKLDPSVLSNIDFDTSGFFKHCADGSGKQDTSVL